MPINTIIKAAGLTEAPSSRQKNSLIYSSKREKEGSEEMSVQNAENCLNESISFSDDLLEKVNDCLCQHTPAGTCLLCNKMRGTSDSESGECRADDAVRFTFDTGQYQIAPNATDRLYLSRVGTLQSDNIPNSVAPACLEVKDVCVNENSADSFSSCRQNIKSDWRRTDRRGKKTPHRSIPKTAHSLCPARPGIHFLLHIDRLLVTRDYSEYFNWKSLILEAGIKVPPNGIYKSDRNSDVRPATQRSFHATSTKSAGNDAIRSKGMNGINDSDELEICANSATSPTASSFSTSSYSFSTSATTPTSSGSRKNVLLAARRMSANGANSSRICTSCGTSKTPYWRDGWGGQVVLCNACGLRYQKFKKYCTSCKYIPRKEEHSNEKCSNCWKNWK